MGINQIRHGFVRFNLNLFLLTRKSKMENAPDIKIMIRQSIMTFSKSCFWFFYRFSIISDNALKINLYFSKNQPDSFSVRKLQLNL